MSTFNISLFYRRWKLAYKVIIYSKSIFFQLFYERTMPYYFCLKWFAIYLLITYKAVNHTYIFGILSEPQMHVFTDGK